MPPLIRDFRLGFWKIHILHHAAARDVWGLWLLEELAEHGYRLSPGTLYPVLASMERNGWLRRTSRDAGAHARRTLRITAKGRRLLEELRRDVAELHAEVVLGKEPPHARVSASRTKGRRVGRAMTPRKGATRPRTPRASTT
ncbi:MAG: helix-turn-helix transcriptional regulator [Thermodesulfobacteriota bacterium]